MFYDKTTALVPGKTLVATFSASVGDYKAYAGAMKKTGNTRFFADCVSMHHDSAEWYGVSSKPQLEERLTHGWAEGVERLRKLTIPNMPTPVSIKRRKVRQDHGASVDMQAVYRGDLGHAWTVSKRQSRVAVKQIAILCNLSCNAGISATKLFWRGASALRLAEALSEAGYSVALYGYTATRGIDRAGELNTIQVVEIKPIDGPLDMSALAAIVCMPGYKRTVIHAMRCYIADREGKLADHGLGYDDSQEPAMVRQAINTLLPMIPREAIIQGTVNDESAAVQWITAAVNSIEGKV